jgi:predicted phosphoadenosine phosphosulfate sulfurtransferase
VGKLYSDKNVYEATQERLKFIFSEFDNVIIAFSGGKDSGLLLHLVMDYIKANGLKIKPALYQQDFEAQYKWTTKYVTDMYAKYKESIEPYWFCQPMAVTTAVGNHEMFWYPWDDLKPDIWIRPIPDLPYVYTLQRMPEISGVSFKKFYRYRLDYNAHATAFSRWFKATHSNKPTITLLGLRAQESLNRYSAIVNKRRPYKGQKWITCDSKDVYSASPIYDWQTEDIWTANAKFGYEYNHLYDLFYKAGVSIHDMRVASPFSDAAKASLNLYRVLEPETWARLVGRVQGANFAAIYGQTRAMGFHDVKLPPGHTWKSYTKFLLATLPANIRKNYIQKFCTSIRFWHKQGGGFSEDVISEIQNLGYDIEVNGVSNYTKDKKSKIIFHGPTPDDTDDVQSTLDIPSWKRMAYCILKNDHTCRYMGFGLTKQQQERVKAIKAKYRNL